MLLLVPGTRAIVEDEQGRVLMCKRSDMNLWSFPGGTAEEGQSLHEIAVQEVCEETDIRVRSYSPIGFSSTPEIEAFEYPNGDKTQAFTLVIHSNDWTGHIDDSSEETNGVRFFPIDEIPDDTLMCDKVTLERFQEWKRTGKFQLF